MVNNITQPTPEEQRRKAKAKIRTIRIWAWIIMLLLLSFYFLSQCALSKPKAKQTIIESCIKNVPFSEKWQTDLKNVGLGDKSDKVINQYCVCMWDEPLEKLNDKQIQSFSKNSPQEQLSLLGGAANFDARDKQCIAKLDAQ